MDVLQVVRAVPVIVTVNNLMNTQGVYYFFLQFYRRGVFITNYPTALLFAQEVLFLIIFREAKHSGVYLTLYNPLLYAWWSLFEIWLSEGVYLNIATEFI